MSKISYVCFPHLFVGFEHDYINTEKRETNTHARRQVMASQRHLGTKHRVPERNVKGVLLGEAWSAKQTKTV